MKKFYFVLLILVVLFSVKIFSANNVHINITTYKNGIPTIVDSLRVNARFYSNDSPPAITDTSFFMEPTDYVWDTVITWDVATDVTVLKNYEYWFGGDVLYNDDIETLRLDSVNFTSNVSFASSGSSSGTGANVVTVFAIDTSGTDDTVSYVNLSIYNSAGSLLATGQTGLTGSANFNIDDGGIILVGTYGFTYTFPASAPTISGSSGVDTISILGYNNVGTSPSSGSYAVIEGYEKNIDGSLLVGAIVEIRRVEGDASSSSNSFNISNLYAKDTTDANGYWGKNVLIEGNYDQSNVGLYSIRLKYGNQTIWSIDTLRITSSTTINIADSLAVR